jgi:hypothetical protein
MAFFYCQAQDKMHKVVFSFDSRNTFILGERAGIFGFKIGIEHDKCHRFGMGFYSIKNKSVIRLGKNDVSYTPKNGIARDTVVDLFAGLDYMTLYYEYVWLSKKRWEISSPVSVGYGTASVNYIINRVKYTYSDVPVITFEPTVVGHYKIFSWVGVGAGFGYRKIVFSNNRIGRRLDAPLYILKIKLFLGFLFSSNKK